MKICAQNPANPEYSLCGMAEDAPETEDDEEEFEFSRFGIRVTCADCLNVIRNIHETYTQKGYTKKEP